jgi:hypothetical protein
MRPRLSKGIVVAVSVPARGRGLGPIDAADASGRGTVGTVGRHGEGGSGSAPGRPLLLVMTRKNACARRGADARRFLL